MPERLDCRGARAPRNDGARFSPELSPSLRAKRCNPRVNPTWLRICSTLRVRSARNVAGIAAGRHLVRPDLGIERIQVLRLADAPQGKPAGGDEMLAAGGVEA